MGSAGRRRGCAGTGLVEVDAQRSRGTGRCCRPGEGKMRNRRNLEWQNLAQQKRAKSFEMVFEVRSYSSRFHFSLSWHALQARRATIQSATQTPPRNNTNQPKAHRKQQVTPPPSAKLSCRCTPQRAQVSAGVGKPRMDSECASGCTWSMARATARLRDSRPWSSQTGQVTQGLR